MALVSKVDTLSDLERAVENLQAGLAMRVVDQLGAQYAIGAVTFDATGMKIALSIDTTKPL